MPFCTPGQGIADVHGCAHPRRTQRVQQKHLALLALLCCTIVSNYCQMAVWYALLPEHAYISFDVANVAYNVHFTCNPVSSVPDV